MEKIFRFFIRKNYPEVGNQITNVEIDKMGNDFHQYLNEKLNDEQKEKILPKSEMDVIMKMDHPLTINGFSPAYMYHFTQWIEMVKEEITKDENE